MSVKIIDKINALLAAEKEAIENGTAPDKKETWYSYEYFPPKTTAGKSYFRFSFLIRFIKIM